MISRNLRLRPLHDGDSAASTYGAISKKPDEHDSKTRYTVHPIGDMMRFIAEFPVASTRTRPAAARILILIIALSAPACTRLIEVAEKPFVEVAHALEPHTGARKIDPVALQGELMRFSDSFHSTILHAANQLRRSGKPPDPMKLLSIELHFSQNVLAAATGANAFANLLDLIVIVTLTRLSVQDYWMPEAFGESARPLLDACLEEEQEIWKIASEVLSVKDRKELRQAIGTWRKQNPDVKTLEALRVTGFVTEIAKYAKPEEAAVGSVFDILDIDPLAALDPAAREIAQTRYFGERALFLAQRMPTLLRWQTELLAMSVANLPEVTQTLADANRLTDAASDLSRVAQELPGIVSGEREKILASVQSSTAQLSTLAEKARLALTAGDRMAQSATGTLKTFQDIQAALNAEPRHPNAAPFRVEDYTSLAEQIAWTATQINATLKSLESLANAPASVAERQSLSHLADDLEQRGERLVERLIRAGILLIAGACLGLFVSLLAYRVAAARLIRSR